MNALLLESPLLLLACLWGTLALSACAEALLHLGKFQSKELLRSPRPPLFILNTLLKRALFKSDWESLYASLSFTKHLFLLAYAVFATLYFFAALPSAISKNAAWAICGAVIAVALIGHVLVSLLAYVRPRLLLRSASPFATPYLILLFPLIALLLQCARLLTKSIPLEVRLPTDKSKIREILSESDLQQHLDPTDQKLISSFVNFKARVVKEIMVPRVDIYALAADTTIREAASLFASEGYSRIPIYRESLDQILGVVLYKDLLKCYASPTHNLQLPLETIAKPVLYAPENKKITQLLQEFRNKQIHMAIIVDEYGGTEGIVTIEDILEELVGEIEDEYDIDEEHSFWELPGGGWVVNAKMTILDIEGHLGIRIPPNPEYETVGGYVYHCAGTIPAKGWRLSHDEFDLEVLASNERSIKKIKIQPRSKKG
ncbi:MAG: HlyC/CorC family transporter [Chlamydiia bacterium]|nr:HlyC/CorC family transporter [Chlamydiia bacterium]